MNGTTAKDSKERTLLQKAHRSIKQMIFEQKFSPGQRLVYQHLATELHMSRTPIINALIRLEEEGFLVSEAFRGFQVRPIDPDEAWNLFGVREALEAFAVEQAIKRATPADIEVLEQKLMEHASYTPSRYTMKKFILDAEVHLYIAAMSGNKILEQTLRTNLEHVYLRFPVNQTDPNRMPVAAAEHSQLLTQMKSKNIRGSVEIIRKHIQEARDQLINCLSNDEVPELFDQVYRGR